MRGLRRLALTSATRQHRVARHFRASAGSGWHCNAGQARSLDRMAGANDLQVVRRVGAPIRQGRQPPWRHPGALPPPKPRTASQPDSATSDTRARTRSIDGSVATPNTTLEMPVSLSSDRRVSARDVVRPVTTRTRLAPSLANTSGTSLTLPAPKRMSTGTARSKRTTGLPVGVFGRCVEVSGCLTRSGHHGSPRCRAIADSAPVSLCAAAASSSL
jgi:hypothetical protein